MFKQSIYQVLQQMVEDADIQSFSSADEVENFLIDTYDYDQQNIEFEKALREISKDLYAYFENVRVCSVCGSHMVEGYCFDGGMEYYCTEDCLHRDFTDEEWEEECNTNYESYWTCWE